MELSRPQPGQADFFREDHDLNIPACEPVKLHLINAWNWTPAAAILRNTSSLAAQTVNSPFRAYFQSSCSNYSRAIGGKKGPERTVTVVPLKKPCCGRNQCSKDLFCPKCQQRWEKSPKFFFARVCIYSQFRDCNISKQRLATYLEFYLSEKNTKEH